ncbi:uncharacterized protein LOC100378624 [Saccoglossus kowalevskii]|uniref:Uncharacterized protein LOC100378624 n=1 Tax=Saccoglossus kowalevskii TaxID=10224 RepID=A0ABM0GTR4_SACKO|nr:PREDICTED: uncharacterized protein LOC100378624 [Saccoglossus kowalevskii]
MKIPWLFVAALITVVCVSYTLGIDQTTESSPTQHRLLPSCKWGLCGKEEYCCGDQQCCKYHCSRFACLDKVEYCCNEEECCTHNCDDIECRDDQYCCERNVCCNFSEIYHNWWFWFSILFIAAIVLGSIVGMACAGRRRTASVVDKVRSSPARRYRELEEW